MARQVFAEACCNNLPEHIPELSLAGTPKALHPLPGTSDVVRATYNALGRVQTKTDESGYTLTFEHDMPSRIWHG